MTLKVVVASKSDETNRELVVLQALKEQGDPEHPGRKHVSHILDSFHLQGPNGQHLCIVLDLLGPNISSVADRCQNYRLDGHLARSVSRQLLLAVDYLHSAGVTHGGKFGYSLYYSVDLILVRYTHGKHLVPSPRARKVLSRANHGRPGSPAEG